MNFVKFFIINLSILYSTIAVGQLDYSDRKGSMDLENLNAIFYNKKTIGYVSSVDISHKSQNIKIITTLDIKADELFSFEFENKEKFYLIESAYNGEFYAFLFLDVLAKKIYLRITNQNGLTVNEVSKNLDILDYNYFTSHIFHNNNYSGFNRYLHEIGKAGFILMYNTVEKNLNTCQIFKISQDTSEEYFYTYMIEQPIKESIFLGASANNLYFSFQKDGKYKNKFTADILSISKSKFEQNFILSQEGQMDVQFFPKFILSNDSNDHINLAGYYFYGENDMVNGYYDGIAFWDLDSKGSLKGEKYTSFQKDIYDLKFNNDNKGKEVGFLILQNAFQLLNKKIYLIGEGFKKIADGSSVGYSIMGMGYYGNYTRLKTTDIAMLEFDENFNYKGATLIDKFNNSLQLGFSYFVPTIELGGHFNQYGLFDYLYTEQVSKNKFSIYYKDFNTSSNGARNYIIGKFTLDNDQMLSEEIEKQPNTANTYFLPNSIGTVMIAEMFKKKKKIYFDFKK